MRLPIHTAGEEVQAHARHTGHRGLDLVLALSAIFISAVSLFVAIEHGRTDRRLVAANSWPFLQVDEAISTHGEARFWIGNGGVGPAKLDSFQVLYKGRPVAGLGPLLEQCCGLSPDPADRARQLPHGLGMAEVDNEVFRPGQREDILSLQESQAGPDLFARFIAAVPEISFRGCYCSVFDECWTATLRDLHPTPVARCAPETSFNSAMMRGR